MRRNLITVVILAALLLLAFPLLGSLFSDLFRPSAPIIGEGQESPTPLAVAATSAPTTTSTQIPSPVPTAIVPATVAPSATAVPTIAPSPTPAIEASPTPTNITYLLPFSQVFAVGQTSPSNSTQVLMYEGGNDLFQVIGAEGALSRLQTADGAMSFWTATASLAAAPPQAPEFDYALRGKTVTLQPPSILACAYNEQTTPRFGECRALAGPLTARLLARITANATSLYLAQIGDARYLVPASAVPSP